MVKKGNILFGLMLVTLVIGVAIGRFKLHAEEVVDDSGISLYSLGDTDENILVSGREETVGDYGKVEGYEITSFPGTGYIEYRDEIHHSMTVTTSEGKTEGYCMQPYAKGPSTDAYIDYNYLEGLGNSSIFNALTDDERERWKTIYVVSTKYAFGGYKADPNYADGSNEHDGGTFGTYIVNRNGKQEVVCGLMIGGKVYSMTKDEARALTQVIVHYVGNRGSQYNISDFQGYTNPEETSAAFKHLKAYADSAGKEYDSQKYIKTVVQTYDQYEPTKAYQSIKWYVYDYISNQWVDYNGGSLDKNNISQDNNIKLKVVYDSKNMCNKLLVNSSVENTTVKYNYQPYIVSQIASGENYYDYITVVNSTSIPVTVTYDKVVSEKEDIQNKLLNNMNYEIDTFSQTAYVDVNVKDCIKAGEQLKLSVSTGTGATAGDCYDSSIGKYGTRMYSSPNVQDCLFLASTKEMDINSNVSITMDITGTLRLRKISTRQDITEGNSCYSMSGATYNVYAVTSDMDESKSDLVGTFVINDDKEGIVTYSKYNKDDESLDGTDSSKNRITNLPLGWYMVCEEKRPSNGSYKLNTEKYYVSITVDDYQVDKIVESYEEPVADPIPFEIVKQCSEGDNVGAAILEGAEFTVWYFKGEFDSIEEIKSSGIKYDRKWILSTEIASTTNNATCIIHQDLLVEGSDEPYVNDGGEMILPLGTIVVAETKAPKGYQLDGANYSLVDTIDGTTHPIEGPYISRVQENQGTVKLSVGNKIIVDDEPIRGDLKLIKKDKFTREPMAGIPFLITSKTTGESHVMVTDQDGVASTSSEFVLHSEKTNENDEYSQNESLMPKGIWFSGNMTESNADDTKGALPYDTYIVKELSCDANKDYYLSDEFEVIITEDEVVYEYGEISNIHKPEIATEAFDAMDMDKKIVIGGRVSVIDRVSYNYLEIGKTYILKGKIVNKTTGQQVLSDEKLVESYVEFTPSLEGGEIDVPFEFELVCCKGDKIVVYEYLYEKETGELVASHEEINCEKQTLTLETTGVKSDIKTPEVTMTMESPKTGDKLTPGILISVMIVAAVGALIIVISNKRKQI